MNAKAKQRAWSRPAEPSRASRADAPVQAAPLAPLVAPEGLQVFDVDAESAGERLDRFLGQAAAAQRIALSRTRLKALIEAGEVSVDGHHCRAIPRHGSLPGRASPSRRRRRRNRRSPART